MNAILRKILAVALALAVGVTFIPLFGDMAYAEGEEEMATAVDSEEFDFDVVLDDEELSDSVEAIDVPEVPEGEGAETTDGDELFGVDSSELNTLLGPGEEELEAQATSPFSVVQSDLTKSTITIKGTKLKGGDTYKTIYVSQLDSNGNASTVKLMDINAASFSKTINMLNYSSAFPVGPHMLYVTTAKRAVDKGYWATGGIGDGLVATLVYSKPSNPMSNYEMYSTYFFYRGTNYSYRQGSTYCDLYMEVSLDGKKWSDGFEVPGTDEAITGLKANTTYYFRTFYGEEVYGGLVYGGDSSGYYSPVVQVKTGIAKLPIKSIKVKGVKIKKHKDRGYGYTITGLWRQMTNKYYTYKIKITVKLKKKPGAKGVIVDLGAFIGKKKLKGNKKKYSFTIGPYYGYKKPKGGKFTVRVYSYANDVYKGYSPLVQKTVKIK